ncbi:MAG TPA: sigma-70 family RNA polymerase sigma factor [Gemmatimonadaceae bacterium]|nr:sigma-70 family RNA polymerase sigma factor [Gemmatimonadaceae bacterium]
MPESFPPELGAVLDADRESADDAWRLFLSRFSPLILHAARHASKGYDEAMDSYAYTLERFRENDFRRLRGYTADPRSKFTTWLVLVARRICIDRQRQMYGRVTDKKDNHATDDERAARRRLVDLAAAEVDLSTIEDERLKNAEDELRTRELKQILDSAIGELETADQLLLTLRFVDGLSAKEIAPIQSWPSPVHVYRRIELLMNRLRKSLERRGVDDPVP